MGDVALAARLGLALVFAAAALGKLADHRGSREALREFGLPEAPARALAIVLPPAELAVAAALLVPSTARWGALGALALLLCFLAAIAVNLARGRTPPCHCFGRLHSAPVGRATLARTAALAVLTGLVVAFPAAHPGADVLGWAGSLSRVDAVEVALGLAVLVLLLAGGSLFLQVIAQNGRLLLRIEALEAQLGRAPADAVPITARAGLAVGAPAPRFGLDDLDGRTVTLDELRAAGKPILLVFSDPSCGPCRALLPELLSWQREHAATLTLALVSRGTVDAHRAGGSGSGLRHTLLQRDREVAHAYGAHGTPTAVVVKPDGSVASALAPGAAAIRALVARAADAAAPAAADEPPPSLRVLRATGSMAAAGD